VPFVPAAVLQSLLAATTQQADATQALAAALSRQAEADLARVTLDRERLQWEQGREKAAAEAVEREHERSRGEDLPDLVQQTISKFAGEDPMLRSQLASYARTRAARGIPEQQIVKEITMGDPTR